MRLGNVTKNPHHRDRTYGEDMVDLFTFINNLLQCDAEVSRAKQERMLFRFMVVGERIELSTLGL